MLCLLNCSIYVEKLFQKLFRGLLPALHLLLACWTCTPRLLLRFGSFCNLRRRCMVLNSQVEALFSAITVDRPEPFACFAPVAGLLTCIPRLFLRLAQLNGTPASIETMFLSAQATSSAISSRKSANMARHGILQSKSEPLAARWRAASL